MNRIKVMYYFFLCLLSLPSFVARALPTCDDVFSGGVASGSASGSLTMYGSSQIINHGNNPNIDFSSLNQVNSSSCVTQACNVTGSSSSSITFPTYNVSSENDYPQTGSSITFGQTRGYKSNDFGYFSNWNAPTFDFKTANDEYRFKQITLNSGATLSMYPGDYFIERLQLNNGSKIVVDKSKGTGSVRLHINRGLFIYGSSSINLGGSAEDIVIYADDSSSYYDIQLTDTASLTGIVFGKGRVTLNGSSSITGNLSADTLEMTDSTSISVSGNSSSATTSDVCTASVTPSCPVSDVVSDVIINEINKDDDWIELYVTNGSNLSLANWTLDGDGNGSSTDVDFVCSSASGCANQTFNTGDFIVIAKSLSGDVLTATQGSSPFLVQGQNLFIDSDLALHNNTQEVILFDDSDEMVHYLRYEQGSYSATWQSCEDENPNDVTITDPPGGSQSGVCTRPDGSADSNNWDQDCGDTPGSSNSGVTAAVDHYEIILPVTSSSVCADQTITVRACENTDCSTLYTAEAVSATLSKTVSATQTTLDTNGFTGSKTVTVNEQDLVTAEYALSNLSPSSSFTCEDLSGNVLSPCQIEFTGTSAFSLANITATSCSQTTATLEAFVYDSASNSCKEITGANNVNFSFSYHTPSNISSPTSLSVSNGTANSTISSSGTASLSMALGSDNNVSFTYNNAGRLSIVASDPNNVISSGSGLYTAIPSYIKVASFSDNDGDNIFVASDPFTFNIDGYCADNVTVTDNYQPGALDFTTQRVTGNVNSTFTYASGQIVTVTANQDDHDTNQAAKTYANASYNEYGYFDLAVSDSNYFGQSLALNWANKLSIGPFVADYLTLDQVGLDAVEFEYHDLTFNYIGKQFGYDGADAESANFAAALPPTIRIKAYNSDDQLMNNYAPAGFSSVSVTSSDAVISGLTSSHSNGTFAQEVSSGSPVNGQYLYTLNSSDTFTYAKSATLMAPTDSSIDITIAANGFVDSDSRSNNALYTLSAVGLEQRYGRLYVQNAADRIGGEANIRASMQYWSGIAWVVATDDTASSLALDSFTTTPTKSGNEDPATITVTSSQGVSSVVTLTGLFGVLEPVDDGLFNLVFNQASDATAGGKLIINWDDAVLPIWMQSAWNSNVLSGPNPTEVAFGNSRGNDRVISWREVSN
ncbi:DUF6701 domain-containing protein [Algibacillus agarilyticus]|uniref:DUF6701 domain-containing protein n=1 Tax=Algibacillus agarilyticus TaxID=2234133 RepID=UPI000DCF7FA8|nr:DUF6701 domain-containing protein [Algibacillus agarilyticus]